MYTLKESLPPKYNLSTKLVQELYRAYAFDMCRVPEALLSDASKLSNNALFVQHRAAFHQEALRRVEELNALLMKPIMLSMTVYQVQARWRLMGRQHMRGPIDAAE